MQSEPMPQPAVAGPVAAPRTNRANVVAWIVMAPMLLGLGYWFYASSRVQSVTVHECLAATGGRLQVTGTVAPTSEIDSALRAMRLGSTDLESFTVRDATGDLVVYYDPSEEHPPTDGARVSAIGRKVDLAGTGGTLLFVADEIVVRSDPQPPLH